MSFSIEDIQKICSLENIEITLHAAKRLEQRGISLDDVIECIKVGKIAVHFRVSFARSCWKRFKNALDRNCVLSRSGEMGI